MMIQHYEQVYEDGSLLAKKRLPPEALVAACAFSGALYFYTDLAVVRSDLVDRDDFIRYVQLARGAGRPMCALIFESEEDELRTRCPGTWTKIASVANVGLWQLE